MGDRVELPTAEERCGACRFWRPDASREESNERGECHRHPPTQNIIDNIAVLLNLRDISREVWQYSEDYHTPYDNVPLADEGGGEKASGPAELAFEASHSGVWPVVFPDDWCGEWRAALPPRVARAMMGYSEPEQDG